MRLVIRSRGGYCFFFSACVSLLCSESFWFIVTFASRVINAAADLRIRRGGGSVRVSEAKFQAM